MADDQKELSQKSCNGNKNERLEYRKLKTYEEMHRLQAEYEKEINAEELTIEKINRYIAEVRNAGNR